AYAGFGFEGKHPSILESDPDLSTAMEIYSFSKSYNMSGFRAGFAVGNKEMIEAINIYQDHTQTGMWGVLQEAAADALNREDDFLIAQRDIFKKRKDMVLKNCQKRIFQSSRLKAAYSAGSKCRMNLMVKAL